MKSRASSRSLPASDSRSPARASPCESSGTLPLSVEACREACHIVETHLQAAAADGKCELPWQYFAALLPVRSVGVHGDVRVHGETVVVRAVTSLDGMSARYSEIPHDVLAGISTEITNSLKGQVNRVVYDITHKPPGTIEWE